MERIHIRSSTRRKISREQAGHMGLLREEGGVLLPLFLIRNQARELQGWGRVMTGQETGPSSLGFYFHGGLIFKNMFSQQNYSSGDYGSHLHSDYELSW